MPNRPSKRSLLILLALCFLYPAQTALAESNSEETRRVVLALFDAFNQHDADALLELYSENAQTR